MLFNKTTAPACSDENLDFVTALADFSLTHTELISFHAMLKVSEISQRASGLNAISQNMAVMTEEVSSSVEQINASMQQVTAGTQEGVNKINNLAALGAKTEVILKEMVGNVNALSAQVKDIDDISQNVSDIADQTNLLALNAAIEAARAGDSGRGFNVVAEEVRKLAGQTKDAVGNVKQISDQINQKTSTTNDNIIEVQETFRKYLQDSGEASELIRESTVQISECASGVDNITNAMQEQTAAADNLSNISEEIAKNTEFISELLKTESAYLSDLLSPCFKISQGTSDVTILAARLMDHSNFLRKMIAEAGSGAKVTNHHECAFGKWYDANIDKYNSIESFRAIAEPHERVHTAGEKLSQELSSENVHALMIASADILKAFIQFRAEFK